MKVKANILIVHKVNFAFIISVSAPGYAVVQYCRLESSFIPLTLALAEDSSCFHTHVTLASSIHKYSVTTAQSNLTAMKSDW